MIIEKQCFHLRDGRSAEIRTPDPADAARVLSFMADIGRETEFMLYYPEELRLTEAEEQRILASAPENPNRLLLACYVLGEVAGMANLRRDTHIKLRHKAELGVCVRRAYWGQGIGGQLLRALQRAAQTMDGLRQLDLDYIEGNERASALYARCGFVPVAVIPEAYRLRDGSLRASTVMRWLVPEG